MRVVLYCLAVFDVTHQTNTQTQDIWNWFIYQFVSVYALLIQMHILYINMVLCFVFRQCFCCVEDEVIFRVEPTMLPAALAHACANYTHNTKRCLYFDHANISLKKKRNVLNLLHAIITPHVQMRRRDRFNRRVSCTHINLWLPAWIMRWGGQLRIININI